ncbi:hypothetical protein LTR85_003858 [Meristemomyces frigidus]|nr:hypothetical protein LTR85_003858 [Meristemomyces frigidus]
MAPSASSSVVDTGGPANPDDITPEDFLKSIRELSNRRDREDMERYQMLEAEAEKRRARRAERAKSISPERTTITNHLPALRSPTAANAFSEPPSLTPSASSSSEMDKGAAQSGPPSPTKDIPEFKGFSSVRNSTSSSASSAAHTPDRNSQPSPSATSLARSGTLSWQRRPASRGGSRPMSMAGPDESIHTRGSRPMSMIGLEGSAHTRNASVEQPEPSRDQIAASLGSRDPSWFKQTADRGVGSAAYRKSAENEASETTVSGRRGLPGMERQRRQLPTEPERQSSQSDTASARDSDRFSSVTSASTASRPDLKSLIAADEPQLQASPLSDHGSVASGDQASMGRTLTMSSSQARLANAPERPSSPTKGMGGFVQSAMLKRSDSVNKRWSAQPGASLSRQNSLASVRSGYGGLQGSHSMPRLEPTSREASNEPASRPSSSSSNLTNLTMTQDRDDNDGFVKPALPRHNRSKSVVSSYSTNAEDGATSPPSSPSKRFSPTKSSWIESALTRPDSPKPSTAKNTQPSWMANIAKAKAERASGDSTPRTGTPKPSDPDTPRSSSPAKTTPLGQGLLKRSDSRDLAPTPRSSTPPFMREKPQPLPETAASTLSDRSAHLPVEAETGDSRPIPPAEKPNDTATGTEPAEPEPKTAKQVAEPQRANKEPLKSAPPLIAKSKPETPPKPPTDFRSTLRSRAPPEVKKQDTPEFLSRFGNLRKTQPEKYVAPDVLKSNILHGKSELAKTGGPVKTVRKDELRESLLAKKEDWKKAKEEGRELPGQVHERKTSGTPMTPSKFEALSKRDLLGRPDSSRSESSPEKAKQATPEAVARHRSLKDKLKVEPPPVKQTSTPVPKQAEFEHLSKQTSAPAEMDRKQPAEASRLAARFNPGLAGILARGPPAMTSGSSTPSRSESPAMLERSSTAPAPRAPDEPSAAGPLQDMRKGRARGPKKRKQGGAVIESTAIERPSPVEPVQPAEADTESDRKNEPEEPTPLQMPKPRAPAGSAASLMMASLRATPKSTETPKESERPITPANSPAITIKPVEPPKVASKADVPDFGGFSTTKRSTPATQIDDNKENADGLPTVKSVASIWGRQPSPKKTEPTPQIHLPSQKDEEAAMRSAGLLASTSPARPSSRNGLGISVEKSRGSVSTPPASAGLPPRPVKSSRVVSGQLQEASPNKGSTDNVAQPATEAACLLTNAFGSVPPCTDSAVLDTSSIVASAQQHPPVDVRTIRKTVQEVSSAGTLRSLPPQEEYTLFSESTYMCNHSYSGGNGSKVTQIFVWIGDSATGSARDQAQATAKRMARDSSAQVQMVHQGHEQPAFLQAFGGILVTRRGARQGAPKQYMLCGRKHLGHITFDEVDFGIAALCSGFVFLVSYPVTLQQTKLYLWKGSACSTEEISAARLAAMDLSEDGEIIEVDDGAEFASFLKIFGRGTMKSSIPKTSELWRQKGLAPELFEARLFRIQQVEQKGGIFAGMFRRPSWNLSPSRSPSRDGPEIKVEVKHISAFTQADLEAEGIYLMDAFSELCVLMGPLFASQAEAVRNTLLAQTLQFATEYSSLTAAERPCAAKSYVLFGGVPRDMKMLFRHWDESRGLWGTAGLMAGSSASTGRDVRMVPLEDVLRAVCRE